MKNDLTSGSVFGDLVRFSLSYLLSVPICLIAFAVLRRKKSG